jgi:uroporphyrinogen decarboxylase
MTTALKNDLILKAAKHEKIARYPVWMMRQAGRYLPEYQAIRSKMSFLELCKNPDKAAEVSIQPLEIMGVDAIIMFSDILVPLEPMGADLSFDTGKPEFRTPIRTAEQIDNLIVPDLETSCSYVYETLTTIQDRIKGEVPVLGFAGAPWTLASYLIEGGGSRNFDQIKKLMFQQPEAMHRLLDKLAQTISKYLILKLKNGASMLQLFDTWASVLSREDYKEFALPYQQKIFAELKAYDPNCLLTIYVNGVSHVFDQMLETSADVISVDWRADLAELRNYIKSANLKKALQGNFDPCALQGSKQSIADKTKYMLEKLNGESGYIANLGHGILPMIEPEKAKVFIDTVKSFNLK